MTDAKPFVAARVNQLDAEDYDDYLLSLLFAQGKSALSRAAELWESMRTFQPEIELLIKLYIYKHTVISRHQSIGQAALSIELRESRNYSTPSKSQLWTLGLTSLILPYVHKRFSRFFFSSKTNDHLEVIIKTSSLLNFVVFLTRGKYKSIPLRVTGVTSGYESVSAALQSSSHDQMTIELLWFTLADFLSTAIPLINFRRIQNWMRKYFSTPAPEQLTLRHERDLKQCAICEQSPTNVHEIGCSHVFCYYCISSLFAEVGKGISCPKCNHSIQNDIEIVTTKLKSF